MELTGYLAACDTPFCELFLSKQPTTVGKKNMTVWRVPSLLTQWDPALSLKILGYTPDVVYSVPFIIFNVTHT